MENKNFSHLHGYDATDERYYIANHVVRIHQQGERVRYVANYHFQGEEHDGHHQHYVQWHGLYPTKPFLHRHFSTLKTREAILNTIRHIEKKNFFFDFYVTNIYGKCDNTTARE